MVCAIKRLAHHLQRAGHANLFDLPGLGKAALEVDMLEGCERVLDAVSLAVAGKLLGIELAPTAPRCARSLMPLASLAATAGNSSAPSTSACWMLVSCRQNGVS